MSGCGEGAEWVEQLRAPRQGHCTSQSQPVKATLLRRAVTPFVTIPRRLRRQNGLIWYYLVHDNFFVSGLDWGTIIQIKDMLVKAFQRFPSVQGLIMHSDQGWQYQHEFYRNELAKHGVIQSMSRKGNCYDNCIMETFFGRLKNEMFYGFEKDSPSFEAFQSAIAEYIDYNNRRIQAKTKWMPPSKFREASMMNC